MLLRFFRSTAAPVILLIPFLGILLWLRAFLVTPDTQFFFDKTQMPLYKVVSYFWEVKTLAATLFTCSLVLIQGFLLIRLNTMFIFINNRSYLPALFFIMITAAIPDLQRLNPVIFSGFFLLLALERIFSTYGNNKLAYDYFIATFYLSVGSLFYPFLAFFMLTVWISLAVLRPFNWREWVFSIIGFLLPVFFTMSYYYLVYNQPGLLIDDIKSIFKFNSQPYDYTLPVIAFLVTILFILILASQFMFRIFTSMKIFPRKAFTIFFWLFINAILIFLFVNKASFELLIVAAIPLSYLLAHYFALLKNVFWGNVFLITLFILLLIIQTW